MHALNSNDQKNYILRRSHRVSLDELHADETIFSLANGSLGTRGHFTEGYGIGDYPQTLMNGFYNTYPFRYEENYKQFPQEGQTIVLLPDASYIRIEIEDDIIDLKNATLVSLDRSLDMKTGSTQRKAVYHTKAGYSFTIDEEKLLVDDKQMIVVKLTITSSNYSGIIKLSSYLRMPFIKLNETDDPRLPQARRHLDLLGLEAHDDFAVLKAKTLNTQLYVNAAITHDLPFDYQVVNHSVIATYETYLSAEQSLSVTKHQFYATTLTDDNLDASIMHLLDQKKPIEAYYEHAVSSRRLFWSNSQIKLSDHELETALLYNIYQLNLSAGTNYQMHISAKGISGEGYEGHYFWDTEAYMLPYFILTQPKKARELLLYRYYTLDASRNEARNLGISRGAKIAWRTINGNESSPYYPAGSAQIHINSDIAMAIIHYYYATNDHAFMVDYGLEILIETALFLLDYGHFKGNKFHLDSVTGPDEYTAVVNDNYYTNSMAKMHFDFVYKYVKRHQKKTVAILEKLSVDDHTLQAIGRAAKQMTLLIDQTSKIIKQDTSFMDKSELDLSMIPKHQFPLLLNYHPLYIYRHQVLKQADAVLSMVFLGEKDLQIYQNTFDYYLARTTHDSSLSKCIYGIAAYHLGQDERAYQYFREVALLDLKDMNKHTQHGLHAANLGGSYLMLIYGLFGVRMGKYLSINPAKQHQIKNAEATIHYQGTMLQMNLKDQVLSLVVDSPIKLMVYDELITVDKAYAFGVN